MNWKNFKYTFLLNAFTLYKLPLVAFVGPRILELGDEKCIIKVPLGFRTKNHLNVMYFGALAIGAELSIALKAVEIIYSNGYKIDFLFKDFNAKFLKRAEGDVHFVFEDTAGVIEMFNQAKSSEVRIEKTFITKAFVPTYGNEPVAEFELTLSIKNRAKKIKT